MSVTRRRFIIAAGTGVAAPAILRVSPATAADVTLRLHHFLPAVSNVHNKVLLPWAKRVEEASGGKLKIDIFPSMQLGGTPPQLYDQAKDGVADIVWTLPGYTASRFPSTEVFELPFVASRYGRVSAQAAQDYAEQHLKEETKDVRLIGFWCHDRGVIHANREVKTMDDLKGLKLRFPTRLAGEALKLMGASPIGMPVPQVPESLAQKVLDGAVIPWEVVPAVKVQELVKYHTEIPGSPTFYVATMMLAMNPAKYNSLPPDLQKAIDSQSGRAFANEVGKVWDDMSESVFEMVKKRGNSIYTIDEAEKARWMKTTEPVIEGWIKQMKERNLDGGKLLEFVRASFSKHEKA